MLAYYLALYHERVLAIRSGGIFDVPARSPKAVELAWSVDPVAHLGETDRLAWGIALRETVKTNREEISRLIAWVKNGEGRGPEAVERGGRLLAEIEAAEWYLGLL